MSSPRIEVDLSKIRHNTRTIVERLKARGIHVTGVTKAVCGHPAIAQAMLDGGAAGLAEARLSNVRRLRKAEITCPITLIRTPMLSQAEDVVQVCEASYNTELTVISALAVAAIRQKKVHEVILMIEMGDLREGILPQDLGGIAQQVVDMPGVALKGIGANFACLSGVAPTATKMQDLSDLVKNIEGRCGSVLQAVSGGNSANLPWALGELPIGRINDLRIGEAILLGVDPVSGNQIGGMYRDAFTLFAEVIETNAKPLSPPISFANPVLAKLHLVPEIETGERAILAIGLQDTDISGLSLPLGNTFIGATSDHLILGTKLETRRLGSEMRFKMNYSALMRAMAAPDVQTNLLHDRPAPDVRDSHGPNKHLALV
ncbi:alanine/ornithine racemase family PLP-dependent enzyme [Octadecabacter sp. 1_MG-2023]|uniref:alanine/ornithine racemase family PLP-dependent enzyme n=1 Tax=unclassified Octadecabacter TaxID=196158 RepID=UPI001C092DA2|nr:MULTISPECIES: alanine/ornithine racemase family PLP-dependent enzyme [unclassified Octadecabacter]MBU2994482.1 alanine/ornithine racemase family PLP-dependent enzyme [Octadecabacter sp. B2R22]MDO6734225.1 alanine/ornithine racemase family PLP-dependent enzyme [Octadecabacter sp. 1_MG-2023]